MSGLAKLASLWPLTSGYLVYHEGVSVGEAWTAALGVAEWLIAAMLLGSRSRRLGAVLAAVLFAGYALAFHRFWEFEIEFQFAQQLLFFKNLLLMAVFLALAECT